jgi:replicative DNA helicase
MFMHDGNRLVFRACQVLSVENQPIDLLTITDKLRQCGALEKAGGASYISQLIDGVPKISNVRSYAKIVQELSRRRSIAHLANSVKMKIEEGKESAQIILADLSRDSIALMSDAGSASMPQRWADVVLGVKDNIVKSIMAPETTMRLGCGVQDFDEPSGGFRRKEVIVIVMPPSHGKTALMEQIAKDSDSRGYKGLIFSAEMSIPELLTRSIARTAGVPLYYLRRPEKIHRKEEVIGKLEAAATEEQKVSLLVTDKDITADRVWSVSQMVLATQALDYIMVDYDQIVIQAGIEDERDFYKAQARFFLQADKFSGDNNVCVVVLCQPRSMDEEVARGKRAPQMDDIFGSKMVRNAADVIFWGMRDFFMFGMKDEHRNLARGWFLKMRNDRPTSIKWGFDEDAVCFMAEPVTEANSTQEGRAKRGK